MSRFFSDKYKTLIPYTPGEQPKDMQYIKLNTNESPFPPHPAVYKAVEEASKKLALYPDPDCKELTSMLANRYGVNPDQVILTNGSDEVLNFAFMAFCDKNRPACFPDITYGFYSVFAEINGIEYTEIPIKDDFTIQISDYFDAKKTIFIANPNAPTGITLSLSEVEEIVKRNPDSVVVIDEAYVDFGGESAVSLVDKYDNLLVAGTFSKSRSMAGARLGFGIACKALIQDLNTIKYSTNPYNINRMTMEAGIATLEHDDYTKDNCNAIIENRDYTVAELKKLGFTLTDSKTNFVFAKTDACDGKELYLKLKERGILVRHFDKEDICQYNRITIGTRKQMETLINEIKNILEE